MSTSLEFGICFFCRQLHKECPRAPRADPGSHEDEHLDKGVDGGRNDEDRRAHTVGLGRRAHTVGPGRRARESTTSYVLTGRRRQLT